MRTIGVSFSEHKKHFSVKGPLRSLYIMNGNLPIVSLKRIYNPVKDFRNKAAKNQ